MSLVALADQKKYAKENAERQVGHLMRELDYCYPPSVIRGTRQRANQAITAYLKAWEAEAREARRLRGTVRA